VRRSDPLFGSLGGVGGEAIGPAPILFWYFGPSAPKDLYADSDSVGWCYDGAGRFWEVFPPAGAGVPFGASGDLGTEGRDYVRGESGYVFAPRTGGPSSGESLLDQIGDFVQHVIVPAAIAILTIVQPEIGIVAAAVYTKVAQIAAGASLSDTLLSAIEDQARSQIGSTFGKSAFDQGLATAANLDAIAAARKDLDAKASGAAAEVLGIKQALETGIAIAQTKAIQDRALAALGTQLGTSGPLPWMAADWNADRSPAADGVNNAAGVYRFAVQSGASPTDIAAGMFPTPAIGLSRLANAIADATVAINPKAAGTVKHVTVPTTPLATSKKAVPKTAAASLAAVIAQAKAGKLTQPLMNGKSGGAGGSGGLLVLAGAAAVGLFLWLKGRR
jgi:hypothetical protein